MPLKFSSVYFVNGTAYAGKSTLVKNLAKKYGGIHCEENYHNVLLSKQDLTKVLALLQQSLFRTVHSTKVTFSSQVQQLAVCV